MEPTMIMFWVMFARVALHGIRIAYRRQAVSEESAPHPRPHRPISDQEFLDACSVKDPDIALRVRKILSDCSGVDEQFIHPSDRLVQDLGME